MSRDVPPAGLAEERTVTRRSFLRALGGLLAASATASLAAACAPSGKASGAPGTGVPGTPPVSPPVSPGTSTPPASPGGVLTLGSNQSDPVPKAALAQVVEAFSKATGIEVTINTVDHATFQNQLSTYLQGRPDDVFTWFAGDRMRFFAEQGLAGDVSDVWEAIAPAYGEGFRAASTAPDGRQYFVPFYTYPWVLLYRRDLWSRNGYAAPATWDELLSLCRRMQADGLVPIAFGDRDGWPAMGFFDILDLRLNGYAFHVALLAGQESWRDARVRAVFERWRELLPFVQPAALGRTWQDAAQAAFGEKAGMFFAGTFAGEQATPDQRPDVELVPFPLLGTSFDAEHAIDGPINGFMLSRSPANRPAAAAFLRFVATGAAQDIWTSANPNYVAAASDADTGHYTPLQRRAAAVIAGSKRIAQFFDRDTRPDFAGQGGMQAFFQDFLEDPGQDLDRYLGRIQGYWDSLA